MLVGHKAN